VRFFKYHGLGNDYVVLDPEDFSEEPETSVIRAICHRNYGVGSDGILLGPIEAPRGKLSVRIFNPDGSEAEKSGNGLRIFSRYLWERGLVGEKPFTILTAGGEVTAQIYDRGKTVTVAMGKVSFKSSEIPVAGPQRQVIDEVITIEGREFRFCAASIGNPHCVIPCDEVSADEAKKWGPLIEVHKLFPNRTNVQFMKVLDRRNIQIEIWERGAGYTLASGSSSCAAAAVARYMGLCGKKVTVRMPGGNLSVSIESDYSLSMTGPVTKVCEGTISDEVLNQGYLVKYRIRRP